MRPHRLSPTRAILFCLALAVLPAPAAGTDSTWKWVVSGNWSDPTYWSDGVPNGIDAVARFTRQTPLPRTSDAVATIDSGLPNSTLTLGSLYLDNYAGWPPIRVGPPSGATLVFDTSSGTAFIQAASPALAVDPVSNRSYSVSCPVVLNDSLVVNVDNGHLGPNQA
jgi:hypothetical protein